MIFVDSGAFIARYVSADQHHSESLRGWSLVSSGHIPCYTSDLVLSESLTLLSRMTGNAFAAETGRLLYTSTSLRVLRPETVEDLLAVGLFAKYSDQNISFCDCVSFVLMKKLGIRCVFGFDRHFTMAGFDLWT